MEPDRDKNTGHWVWLAVRPKTLSMAAAPVLLGSALAWSETAAPDWPVFFVTLFSALAIQAGTNLFNDVRDAERGADGPDRLGPLRVTAAGLAPPRAVRNAAALSFLAAFVAGLYLVFVGGLPILLIGLASISAGYAYSAGPRPLSHTPWGELFVLLFFGIMAVGGSYYLQADRFSVASVLLGVALGAQAAAVLLVNNLRDISADRAAGRTTLVGVVGETKARWLYAALMLAPFVIIAALPDVRGLWAPWLVLPLCAWLGWSFIRAPVGPAMNGLLARSAQVQAVFAAVVSVSLLL
jgi:1,4-dihydroxy-2-naphthoate octaprenyltransferase